ncbi:tumor necrosis factor receptor superfamily member 1A isoform X2 [Melanotaenia boesemani]|uniref:tumor necrosis factor receptor superfamily member 1A isoform X2 n=1 Tax=Melanotaenia boesemani TaxID=1250792 RepID=UPI001C05BF86|nr:tumor necrosis factor receptor superfamily member 1A isoform X2 [Melanotaenia boesemani]
MEGTGHLHMRNKIPFVGILLLLMHMTVTGFTLQNSEKQSCPAGDFLTDEGICCNKCSAGFKLAEKCHAAGQRSNCTICPNGEFTEHMNSFPNCRRCKTCKEGNNEFVKAKCIPHQNTVCQCNPGYYKSKIDSQTYECLRCTPCQPDERQLQKCSEDKNTACGCQENYHKVKGKCQPCENCTEPKDPSTTHKPTKDHKLFIQVIAGILAVGLVLLSLVILLTYMVTKRHTKKKMKSTSFQPTSTSLDSCQQNLVNTNEPSDNSSVKTVAFTLQTSMSEQDMAILPDCVPLEIKIPDLIYTVLDLVPVQQMKQLVRSLGLKDTEIEQAEMDHRSCKEAHYQMLRMWAERSSHSVGRGRCGILHRPLLEELLDKLRQIHLGWAAEELETKYGIQ